MATKTPTVVEHNIETGEITERPMTAEEIALEAQAKEYLVALQAHKDRRAAVLAALAAAAGIDVAEVEAVLS